MPLPDGYLPRKGDVVVIHAIVKYDADEPREHIFLVLDGARYSDLSLPIEKIVGLHMRHWEEGDEVTWMPPLQSALNMKMPADGFPGEILAVHGERCWVKTEDGGLVTAHANELQPRKKPAPPPLEEPPPAPAPITTEPEEPL